MYFLFLIKANFLLISFASVTLDILPDILTNANDNPHLTLQYVCANYF